MASRVCVEYKLVQYESGGVGDPSWVEDGQRFYNPADKSYVGFVQAEEDREFYVPDTVVEMNKDQFIQRVKAIHATEACVFTQEIGEEAATPVETVVADKDLDAHLSKLFDELSNPPDVVIEENEIDPNEPINDPEATEAE